MSACALHRLLDVNQSFERQTGLADAKGKRMRELRPKHEEHWFETYGRIALTGESARFQARAEQLGRWYDVYAFRVGKAGDRQVAILFNDITERIRSQDALKESEARFRELADGSPTLIWVNGPDGCEFVNRRYLEFVGVSAQEDVRRFDWAQFLHPEDRDAYLQSYLASVQGRTPFDAVFRFRRHDGVYRWMRSTGIPRLSPNGESIGCIGSTTDIHDVKEAEQRVRELNEALRERNAELDTERMWWRGVVEGIADEVWVADAKGNLSLINLPDTTAMSLTPFENHTIEEVVEKLEIMNPDGSPRPPEETPLLRSLRTGEIVRGEEMMRIRATGELHHRQFSCAPTRNAQGNVVGAVAIVRDITDKKQAEEALREADRRKDEFLAVLSHELRNPLAPIRSSLYVLDHAAPGGEQARRAKAVIERQVNQMTRLVSDLLDVSRITRGKVQLQRERIDLREVIHRTLEDHRSVFVARGIELRGELPEGPVWADGDPARIGQAVGNLLHNASKFTNEGGVVVVGLYQKGSNAVLRIRDTGVGIPPDLVPRLFQPFTQADRTLDRSAGGLGLGLALVKGLIEMHGGVVCAHSDGIGKGAEFALQLPAGEEPALVARPELKLVVAHARRVLVIEDNVDAAESLKEVLEIENHEVEVAFTGPEGLTKARQFLLDIVLCDIGLPGMDGYQVARAFRADEDLHDISLVALTGYALAEDHRKATDAGFDRHLAKPPDIGALERLLAELPGRHAA